MRREDQERAVIEVVDRAVEAVRVAAESGGPSVEEVAADVPCRERLRLEATAPTRAAKLDRAFYREAAARGTVVLAPTHQSHMDSIVLGYALYRMGLPPFTYGAGLNLFGNPLLSFFLRHLGACRIDRRKKNALYKAVLKEYAAVSIEYGDDGLTSARELERVARALAERWRRKRETLERSVLDAAGRGLVRPETLEAVRRPVRGL